MIHQRVERRQQNSVEFGGRAISFCPMLNWRCFLILLFSIVLQPNTNATTARIKKVLPHYLDTLGRHTLSPSLLERDAYQAQLRRNPAERSALRFDVNWKCTRVAKSNLTLRLELRSSGAARGKQIVLETDVKSPTVFSKWTSLTLEGSDYANFGELLAWRASLWEGETLITEQKSFLW